MSIVLQKVFFFFLEREMASVKKQAEPSKKIILRVVINMKNCNRRVRRAENCADLTLYTHDVTNHNDYMKPFLRDRVDSETS